MHSQRNDQIDVDPRRLREELANAARDESLPRMLRNLLKSSQIELNAWFESRSDRGLAIAAYAVGEWKRWTVTKGL